MIKHFIFIYLFFEFLKGKTEGNFSRGEIYNFIGEQNGLELYNFLHCPVLAVQAGEVGMRIFDSLAAFIIFLDVMFVIFLFLYFYVTDWKSLSISKWYIKTLGILSIGALLYFFLATHAKAECNETLCMRLNNPMCVTGSKSNPWNGQVKIVQQGLVHFQTMEDGLRAGAKVLRGYKEKHKINTLEGIVRRYCTGNRDLYAKHLERAIQRRRGAKIDICEFLPQLMKAIIVMENGKCIFTERELKEIAYGIKD